jgi:hypothetical protein
MNGSGSGRLSYAVAGSAPKTSIAFDDTFTLENACP